MSGDTKRPLPHGWVVLPSKTFPDRVYFYNVITKCSTWDNPCEPSKQFMFSESPPESPVTRRKKKKKKSKKSKKSRKLNNSSDSEKNVEEVEDYDEDQDEYFDNISINKKNFSRTNCLSPQRSPDFTLSPIVSSSYLNQSPKSNNCSNNAGNKSDATKQLWLHFTSSSDNDEGKKSVALSHLDRPSTSSNCNNVSSSGNVCDVIKEKYHENERNKESAVNNYSNKKKNKKQTCVIEGKRVSKTVKTFSFKRKDKTPAQTRLINLRKQNEEQVKKAISKYPDLFLEKNNKCGNKLQDSVSKSLREACSDAPMDNVNLRDKVPEMENCNYDLRQGVVDSSYDDLSSSDFFEEMDWEPSNEELDVKNINVFRQQVDKYREIYSNISFVLNSDKTNTLPPESTDWVLILDTNIFVSCLTFVKELRDTNVPGLGLPVLYIPWRVLQELDNLKDSNINSCNKQLSCNVRKAITYLNENFKSRHPRCIGQSYQDFSEMVDGDQFAPDDEILQTCIKMSKLYPEKKLALLTNDKNLQSKAIVSSVEAYSKEEFQKKYFSSNGFVENVKSTYVSPVDASGFVTQMDNVVCELKSILKDFMSAVVENEMKMAFGKDWIKLALKKPPWTLQEALECFIKHWRSVFFLVFPNKALEETNKLSKELFKKEQVTNKDICKIIKISITLVTLIKRSPERPYAESIEVAMAKLSKLERHLSLRNSQGTDETLVMGIDPSSLQSSSISTSNRCCSAEEESQAAPLNSNQSLDANNGVLLAKNLFRDIWDSLRSFCISMLDMINSSIPNQNEVIPETRLRLSHILLEVNELVVIVERILQMRLEDVSECHPIIRHLSDFLCKLFSAMGPETQKNLPKCLAAFCCNVEGRSLLSQSLKDFKDFSQKLTESSEYFEKKYAGL